MKLMPVSGTHRPKIALRFLLGLAPLVFGLLPSSLLAAQRGTERLLTDAAVVRKVLEAMDDAVWAPDGEAADRHVYVLYGTHCAFSRKLHADTRGLLKGVQLRWIAVTGPAAGSVVTDRTTAAVGKSFTAAAAGADPIWAQRAIAVNAWASSAPPDMGTHLTYPTLIYASGEGVKMHFGAPADLRKLVAQIKPRPERASYAPASLGWLENARLPLTSPRSLRVLANRNPAPIEIRIAPDLSARVGKSMAQGFESPVRGFLGTEWLEVESMSMEHQAVPGYIHAPREIRLDTLNFSVKPAAGELLAEGRDIEIRSHPDLQAPLLDTLPAGYTVRISGETTVAGTVWDEVVPFTDGTKGYVRR